MSTTTTTITIKNSKTLYYLAFTGALKIKTLKDTDGHSIDISKVKVHKLVKEGTKIYIWLKMNERRRRFRVKQEDTKLVRPFLEEETTSQVDKMRNIIKKLRAKLNTAAQANARVAAAQANANARIAAAQANANARVAAAQANANARVAAAQANVAMTEPVVENIVNAANALKAVTANVAPTTNAAANGARANAANRAANAAVNGATNGARRAANAAANGAANAAANVARTNAPNGAANAAANVARTNAPNGAANAANVAPTTNAANRAANAANRAANAANVAANAANVARANAANSATNAPK